MVSIKTMLVVLFISAVSAKKQLCYCGDPEETQVICNLLAQTDVKFIDGGDCEVIDHNAAASFTMTCALSDKNRFGADCREP
ncbi:uncharacterized protein L3040_007175 [Drepanopeziza brunnea f. sp. 'multigermtubi']|uniref:Uncharacterized protein n=1 Tax=Marssonina brunnea f. sp. multigermtubi (strain MB_m1) TaxID=1072389 RepID=K1XHF3_MARBU|nr:uncharacterized protein MBM_02130 [Drepanopeziza brunnea f. sp. 'multigermtubi' MB_m1]EKD20178.1 hypothetical protein MBM_02130 [Drepanopeziza brunnea f. sp. 'multigermtubi' MB_m1]KAJ5038309.1 hypothetical protein L3040_007175 [Drepanopeziza brunnea f. sp. 'multigermtubi']